MGQKIISYIFRVGFNHFYQIYSTYKKVQKFLLYHYKIIYITYFEKESQTHSTWIAIYKPHLHFLEEAYSENEIFMCMLEAI